MTNRATTAREKRGRDFFAAPAAKDSDQAPMVVTRLSGWIDIGEGRAAAPSWIVPTRVRAQN